MSTKKKKSFTQFVTRPKSNSGVELTLPDTDGEKVTIIGVHSDAFREKSLEIFKSTIEDSPDEDSPEKLTGAQINEKAHKNQIELLSACVIAWSFSEKCTPENVKEMLTEAPHIRRFIDKEIDNQKNFMGKL